MTDLPGANSALNHSYGRNYEFNHIVAATTTTVVAVSFTTVAASDAASASQKDAARICAGTKTTFARARAEEELRRRQ